MVIFVVTRSGYEAVRSRGALTSPLWVAMDVLTDSETAELRANGIVVTNFTRPIDPANSDAMDTALDTIAQHHPGERIVVEGA